MITIEGLCKDYGPRIAIRDLTFEVRQGEVLGFLGPNGAGKTTTMKIITAFMPPTSGRVSVMGFDTVKDSLKARSCIGYLPENNPLYNDLKVESFLAFAAGAKGLKSNRRRERVKEVIQACGLEEVGGRVIGRLSKGFRQRVGLAQALINDPPVLVLDEPTIGLDPKQIYEIRHLIKDVARDRTIVLSSHILPEVSQLCDRVAIINKGGIVAIDRPENLTTGLREHTSITVRVGRDSAEAARVIGAQDGVVKVVPAEDGLLTIDTGRDTDLRPAIVRQLVAADIDVYEITRRDLSLEEIFMRLITEEASDA
ncbi:MAG TPA: ATP-binding cassette domain-containing protein [Deltaproteobacteria bacterium]|nr:ATP-binding cassette domain-containing protein [Deltaproteobacteria bacterium]